MEEVQAIICDLSASGEIENGKTTPMFAYGKRVVLCGIALSVFQQLVGINTVLYYGPTIFETMGFHIDAAYLAR